MSKFFDIAPRRKGGNFRSVSEKSRKSQSKNFYYLIIGILFIVFIYSLSSLSSLSQDSSQQTSANNQPVSTDKSADSSNQSQADLPRIPSAEESTATDDQGQVVSKEEKQNLEKSKISLKVINATGKSGVAASTKEMLEKEGFVVAEIGTAKNIYNSTVIYYKEGEEETAKLVAETLKDHQVSLEKDPQIVGQYDLLVVIGKK